MVFRSAQLRSLGLSPSVAAALSTILDERQGLLFVCSPAGGGAEELGAAVQAELLERRPSQMVRDLATATPGSAAYCSSFRSVEAATACTRTARHSLVVAVVSSGEQRGAFLRLCEMLPSTEPVSDVAVHVVTTRLLVAAHLTHAEVLPVTPELIRGSCLEPRAADLCGRLVYSVERPHRFHSTPRTVFVAGVGCVLPPWERDRVGWEPVIELADDAVSRLLAGSVTLDDVVNTVPDAHRV